MIILYMVGALLLFVASVMAIVFLGSKRGSLNGNLSKMSGSGMLAFTVVSVVAIAISWNYLGMLLTITLICFIIYILMKWKKVDGAGFALSAGIVMLLFLWLGPSNVTSVGQQIGAGISGAEAPTPAPLNAEAQAARLERERQAAELVAVRAAAEAAARAQAEEAARLTREVTSQLPTTVRVPHCNQGWSQPVIIPAGWSVRSSWSGRVTRTEYLNDGQWREATTLHISVPVEAFRYCTTSQANLMLDNGHMRLVWNPF
jgi:hypothetical protein